jgi:uncharacterized protein YecE (DUF72 family)
MPEAPPSVRVGCCGWSYREWVGPFYRSGEKMFAQYARSFDVVEMDSSFYRVPDVKVMLGLARAAPQGFLFTIKVPKVVTHEEFVKDTERARETLQQYFVSLEPLKVAHKLALALVQLPPKFAFEDREDLERLLGTFKDKGVKTATEFRHPSWLAEENVSESLRVLRENSSSYTVVDEPLLPPVVHRTASPTYVRLHGRNPDHWYDYNYSGNELREWADKVSGMVKEGDEVILVFNNHPHGNAPNNAMKMLDLLGLQYKNRFEEGTNSSTR